MNTEALVSFLLADSNETKWNHLEGGTENDFCAISVLKCRAIELFPSHIHCQGVQLKPFCHGTNYSCAFCLYREDTM